jgi:hypothetical protein
MDDRTPQGKIGRLPHTIREQVNARLLNNEPASRILTWLNATPEQLWVCTEYHNSEPVSPKNLSDWKVGGYQKWLSRRERIDTLQGLTSYCIDLAKNSGLAVTDAAAAIVGGQLLSAIETASETDAIAMAEAVTMLRRTDIEREKLERGSSFEKEYLTLRRAEAARKETELQLKKKEGARKDKELALSEDQFRWRCAEAVAKYARRPEIQKILASKSDDSAKMEQLVLAMFGPVQEKEAPSA